MRRMSCTALEGVRFLADLAVRNLTQPELEDVRDGLQRVVFDAFQRSTSRRLMPEKWRYPTQTSTLFGAVPSGNETNPFDVQVNNDLHRHVTLKGNWYGTAGGRKMAVVEPGGHAGQAGPLFLLPFTGLKSTLVAASSCRVWPPQQQQQKRSVREEKKARPRRLCFPCSQCSPGME